MKSRSSASLTGWIAVLSTALLFFYWFVQLSLSNTLVDYYTDKYALTHYGLFTSMYLIGNVLVFFPAGLLLDRFASKIVVAAAMVGMLAGISGLILSVHVISAFLFMLLIGAGGGCALLACVRVAANWFPEGEAGFPISMCITLAFFGSYLGNAGGQYILQLTGSGYAVQLVDLLMGVGFLVIILWGVKTPREALERERGESLVDALRNLAFVMRNPQNWLAGLFISLMNFPVMLLEFSFGQSYLVHSFDITHHQAANIAGIISIGFMIGGPLWNKWSDNYHRRKPFIILGGLLSLLVTALLLLPSLSLPLLWGTFFLIGVFTAAQTLGYPLITESNPPAVAASATSLASLLIMGGGAVAQNIFGEIELWVGYSSAYYLIPVCIAISVGLGIILKEAGHHNAKAEH